MRCCSSIGRNVKPPNARSLSSAPKTFGSATVYLTSVSIRAHAPLSLRTVNAPSPEERIGIVAQPALRRQFLQLPGVASAKNHIVRLEGGDQTGDDIGDIAPP